MEDKVLDLMSKMYAEMQQGFSEVRQDINGVKQDITGLKEDVTGLKEDVTGLKRDIIRLENKIDDKLGGLFDGYTQHEERLGRMDRKLDILVDNYERQDVKIEVIHSRAK